VVSPDPLLPTPSTSAAMNTPDPVSWSFSMAGRHCGDRGGGLYFKVIVDHLAAYLVKIMNIHSTNTSKSCATLNSMPNDDPSQYFK
jgi:hypothetical protein